MRKPQYCGLNRRYVDGWTPAAEVAILVELWYVIYVYIGIIGILHIPLYIPATGVYTCTRGFVQ